MQRGEQHSFVPPKGRQGHSVPIPKPLGVEVPLCSVIDAGKCLSSTSNQPLFPVSKFPSTCSSRMIIYFNAFFQKLDSWPTTDLQHSGSSSGSSTNAMSPAQFYAHRDHVFGGSLSKLDRMRSYQDSIGMEAFDETEEYEDTGEGRSLVEGVWPASPSFCIIMIYISISLQIFPRGVLLAVQ